MKRSLLARINYSCVYAYELLDTIVHFPDLGLKRFYKVRVGQSDGLILELGCGTGRSTRMFAGKNLRVVSADINKAFVAYGSRKKRIATPVVSSAYDLGFRDETFDTIIVPDAFHHILDHDRLFSECARVLKPGGTLIIFDIVLDKQAPNAVINHFVDGCIWSLTVQGFTDRINALAGTHRFAVTGLATSKEKTVMGLLGGVDIEARLVKQR